MDDRDLDTILDDALSPLDATTTRAVERTVPAPSPPSPPEPSPHPDPEHASLLKALDRLLSIGSFYPPGHVRCLETAEALRTEMARLLAGSPTLGIAVRGDELIVHGAAVPSRTPGAHRLHEILTVLCVESLEIDLSAAAADLHASFTRLLHDRHLAETTTGLRQFDYLDLPDGVRVRQREFGLWTGAEGAFGLHGERVQAAVGRVLGMLESGRLDPAQEALWRGRLEKVFTRVSERLRSLAGQADEAPLRFTRSLEEVLDLGVHAIGHAMQSLFERGEEIGSLQDMFDIAEKAVALSDDAESVELMIDVLKQVAAEERDERVAEGDRDGDAATDYEMSLPEFRSALDEAEAAAPPWHRLDDDDAREELSLAFQILLSDSGRTACARAGRRLDAILSRRLSPRESGIVAGAVGDALRHPDPKRTDDLLARILDAYRRMDGGSTTEFLLSAGRGLDEAARVRLWPHLVNEILLGIRGEEHVVVQELYRLAADLPDVAMRRAVPRLERLEAMRQGEFARWLFRPPVRDLYPVFRVLLRSSRGDELARQLLEGLRLLAPEWAGAAAFAVVTPVSCEAPELLERLLEEAPSGTFSDAARALCGHVVATALQDLGREEREADWVAGAVAALGEWRIAAARPLLREIATRSRWVVLREWPRPCREAAVRALAALDRGAAPRTDADDEGGAP